MVRLFTSDVEIAHREELLHDLLGVEHDLEPMTGDPPLWLKRAREAIAEVPEKLFIQEVAREAGVHRVQLSRMFHRFYGIPPSLFRHRALIARAVDGLVRSDARVSDIAAEAGFYDQAHLTRSLRRDTGLTPGFLRTLFATATSVQAPARSRW
jgi:AraC-like DNA-binding protein